MLNIVKQSEGSPHDEDMLFLVGVLTYFQVNHVGMLY